MRKEQILDGNLTEILEIAREEFQEDCGLSPNLVRQLSESYAGNVSFSDAMKLIDAVYYVAMYQGYRIGRVESDEPARGM